MRTANEILEAESPKENMLAPSRAAAWSFAAMVTFATLRANADLPKAQCVAAHTNGQSLRRQGKLAEAREQLRMCSDPKCPMSTDCIRRLDELETAQPTVVFDVKDSSGHDLSDVEVAVDGRLLLHKLDGASTRIDVGEHSVTFTMQGRPPVTQKVVVREGEKLRPVTATIESPAPTRPGPRGATEAGASAGARTRDPVASSPAVSSTGTSKVLGFAIAGAGVAGLVTGGVFGLMAISAKTRQTNACAGAASCDDPVGASTAHDDAVRNGTISTIAVLAGAAVTTLGVVLVATAPSAHDDSPSTKVTLAPSIGPLAGLCVVGIFEGGNAARS